MAIKMVAMDLDDTLLDGQSRISPRNREMIVRAMDAGIKIILASGRMYGSIVQYAEYLQLDDPIIAYNGAMIRKRDQAEALIHEVLPLELARELLLELRQMQIHTQLYVSDRLYVSRCNDKSEAYALASKVEAHEAGDLLSFLQESPTKILVIDEPAAIDECIPRLRERFADRVHITKSKPQYLEFMKPGINKGSALKRLREYYGFAAAEVMAIGDAPNDIEMLCEAGTGVAVGNAFDEVKAVSAFQVASNIKDGVAEAIEYALAH